MPGPDEFLLIWLPSAVALFEIFATLVIFRKNKSFYATVFSMIIAVFNGLAVYTLMEIFLGAWPVYFPHVLIFVSGILLFILFLGTKKEVFELNEKTS